MHLPRASLRSCILLAMAWSGLAGARVAAVELSAQSPFMPQGSSAAPAAQEAMPLELRGILELGDAYKFCLYDPSTHKNTWVGLNEKDQPFVVSSYDAAHDTVTVQYQGRQLALGLPQPKITPMATPQFAPAANNFPRVGQGPSTPGNPQMNAAEEQRRLEAITAEIRRRRAMREAATMQQRQQQQQSPQPSQ